MGRLERLEEWKRSAPEQAVFMQRVAEGETPKAVCEAMGLPYSATMRHVKSTAALYAEYRSSLETWVEALAHETVSIADGVAGADEASEVAAAKLACDTRFRLASKLYREMFGEDVKPTLSLTLNVGDVTREIRELEARLGISGAGLTQGVSLSGPRMLEVVEAEVLSGDVSRDTAEPPI